MTKTYDSLLRGLLTEEEQAAFDMAMQRFADGYVYPSAEEHEYVIVFDGSDYEDWPLQHNDISIEERESALTAIIGLDNRLESREMQLLFVQNEETMRRAQRVGCLNWALGKSALCPENLARQKLESE